MKYKDICSFIFCNDGKILFVQAMWSEKDIIRYGRLYVRAMTKGSPRAGDKWKELLYKEKKDQQEIIELFELHSSECDRCKPIDQPVELINV